MSRLIDADALISDLEYDVELDARALDCLDNEYRRDIIQFDKDYKQNAIDLLRKAPTVQPEPTQEIQDILDYLNTVLHPIVSPEHWDVYSRLHDMVSSLPYAQPDEIPLEWIDKHLEWLDNCDNDFAQLAKVSIKAMVELWKKDGI